MSKRLTKDQKQQVLEIYKENQDIMHITRIVFQNETLDGRSQEGRAVRRFLAEENLGYNTTKKIPKRSINLLADQQNQVKTWYMETEYRPIDMARLLWPEQKIQPLGREVRCIERYIKNELDPTFDVHDDEIEEVIYEPPKNFEEALLLVNEVTGESLQRARMSSEIKEGIGRLVNIMRGERFKQSAASYSRRKDARLFEHEFVRLVFDKPDLTWDEVNLYINLCTDIVQLKVINKQINKLNSMFDETEDKNEMTVKLSEMIKSKTGEQNQCMKRIETLTEKLNGKRSDRMKDKKDTRGNILNLIQTFRNHEERQRMLAIAKLQQEAIEQEVERLETLDQFKARILGIGRDAVL